MQRFLKDTMVSRYIKALLYNIYIPNYKCVTEGDYIVASTWLYGQDRVSKKRYKELVKEVRYIYHNNIIRCTKTGILGQDADYEVVDYYDTSKVDLKISSNFLSKESYYDTYTHTRLGELLRYYRAQTGINLLPLYNCFNNKFNSSFSLTRDGINSFPDKLKKVIQVPIKFNVDYTIAIDCPDNAIIMPALLDKDDFLFVGNTNMTGMLYDQENYIKTTSLNFLDPQIIRINNSNVELEMYEDYLVLLIQIPKSCDSSIVILEGNYKDVNCRKIISLENVPEYNYYGLESIDNNEQDILFTSSLSLLRMNDKVSYAFSDKLILYLLGSAITSEEDIYNNILRVQNDINANHYYKVIPDVWDNMLRKILFDNYVDNNDYSQDILGYVDNDLEQFLLKRRSSS